MRILHTADWHLGRTLYNKRRHEDHAAFFTWLLEVVRSEAVEVLLMAGDVFDSTTPGPQAQQLYYQFLGDLGRLQTCRHVVVIGGNHDSPSLLDAPREVLRYLRVQVVGSAAGRERVDEVLELMDDQGKLEMLVCAVPYLRDRDVRLSEEGESIEDKDRKLIEGIRKHYAEVVAEAESRRIAVGIEVPLVAMGHLFAAGAKTEEGDGVRELYVGSLARVGAEMFPASCDYVALGHLHVPQVVGGLEHIRYSGSPIPMGFGEAAQQKQVILIDFQGRKAVVRKLPIPVFQRLARVCGDLPTIFKQLGDLRASGGAVWVEVSYEGKELIPDLREQVEGAVSGSEVELLKIRNNLVYNPALSQTELEQTLEDLDPLQVFDRLLESIPEVKAPREDLFALYRGVLLDLEQAETHEVEREPKP